MSHFRKPLAAAVALNSVIFVLEGTAGLQSGSLSLVMDGVHNLSDELALVMLFLAFVLSRGISRNLVVTANLFNSVGLLAVSALLLWQAAERLLNPAPVTGLIPIVVGLLAAAGNWGVAQFLKGPGRTNAAIRLAYIHNIGDVLVSLAPVLAGVLVLITGESFFDPLLALAVGVWIIVSTAREIIGSEDELISPGKITCCHSDDDESTAFPVM